MTQDNHIKEKLNLLSIKCLIFVQKGIRRDLVSEPRKPDVYLPVVPVAFGSQLNDEVDENERFVVFIRHNYL